RVRFGNREWKGKKRKLLCGTESAGVCVTWLPKRRRFRTLPKKYTIFRRCSDGKIFLVKMSHRKFDHMSE
uniref:Uncharacterized protein n=1 Tax=Oryza brachyantha TaxID=4533 RepID=J3N3A5_ORYBR